MEYLPFAILGVSVAIFHVLTWHCRLSIRSWQRLRYLVAVSAAVSLLSVAVEIRQFVDLEMYERWLAAAREKAISQVRFNADMLEGDAAYSRWDEAYLKYIPESKAFAAWCREVEAALSRADIDLEWPKFEPGLRAEERTECIGQRHAEVLRFLGRVEEQQRELREAGDRAEAKGLRGFTLLFSMLVLPIVLALPITEITATLFKWHIPREMVKRDKKRMHRSGKPGNRVGQT